MLVWTEDRLRVGVARMGFQLGALVLRVGCPNGCVVAPKHPALLTVLSLGGCVGVSVLRS